MKYLETVSDMYRKGGENYKMNTSYKLIKKGHGQNLSEINSHQHALAVFNELTLKEKCLYLVKVSKRNTNYQALALLVSAISIFAANYLLSVII
nr:hypothetical protein [Sedimentibacter sp.]